LLAGNVKAAVKAIELADKRVEQLDDFRLHPLRSLLAMEKMRLEEMTDVDIEGMVLQLQTAINQADQLQVVSGPAVAQIDSDQQQQTEAEPTWKQAIDGVWQQIRSLVVIRHKQDGSAAVLVPEQRYFLYQNLKLKLETARFALLRYDVSLFRDSLESAVDWLHEYFVGSERDAMLKSLKALQTVSISQELPDISGSSTWLKQQGLAE
jgi:uroporphyrin-3 C-methyltransferase